MSEEDKATTEEDDDITRILLLLTDVLGDLQLVDHSQQQQQQQQQQQLDFWTPKTVLESLRSEKEGGGLSLALQLVKGLHGHSRNKKVESWKELHDKYPSFWPPWVSLPPPPSSVQKETFHLISKLEVLLFLASSLQSKHLRELKASTSTPHHQLDSKVPIPSEPNSMVHAAPSTDGVAQGFLSLPAHLTAEQIALIQRCYEGFQADYNQRRLAMQQRLYVMACNFAADNKDNAELEQLKQKIQSLSLASDTKVIMNWDHESLRKHFTTPPAHRQVDDAPIKKAMRNETIPAVDRGGRTDGSSSRTAMPQWVEKQQEK